MSLPKFCAVCLLAVQLAACGSTPAAAPNPPAAPPVTVGTQPVAALATAATTVRFAGTVAPQDTVRVVAAAGGKITTADLALGKTVAAGQLLLKIDDAGASGGGAGLTGSSAASMQVAVSQAEAAVALAEKNLASVRAAAAEELAAAQTTAGQASRSAGQTVTTTAENLKSAELVVQQASLAREQAATALKNRQQTAAEATANTAESAQLAARTQRDTADTIWEGLAQLAGFDPERTGKVSYDRYLGALDAATKTRAQNSFDAFTQARSTTSAACTAAADCLAQTETVVAAAETAVADTLTLLEKSITAADFSATQLAALKTTATGYQTQLAAASSALTAARQQLTTTASESRTALDSLQQSLALAEKAEASARQNLATLRSSVAATRDAASAGATTATANLAALSARQKAALAAAETQLAQARLARQNAVLARDSFTQNRLVTAPTAGVITQKAVAVGDSVAPGTLLFTLSPTAKLKVDTFIDGQTHALLAAGAAATVLLPDGQKLPATVLTRAATADPVTRRFQLEISPKNASVLPPAGSLVDVELAVTYRVQQSGHVFVPAAVLTVSQTETTLFAVVAGHAKRIAVTVVRVLGETVEVALPPDLPADTLLITTRAELADGQAVTLAAPPQK